MQFLIKVAIGLAAAGSLVTASDFNPGSTINLERRDQNVRIGANKTLDLKAVDNHIRSLSRKYDVLLKNFKNNMGKDHPLLSALIDLLDKRDGTVALEDVKNQQLWAGKIKFGNSEFMIDFDTGSSDTIADPNTYNPKASRNSKRTSDRFRTAYADGTTAEGSIYTDVMELGGSRAKNVALGVSNQRFNDDGVSHGIAGLGFPSIQTFPRKYDTIFGALMKQKAVSQPVFQFSLQAGQGSTLNIGKVDKSKFNGDLTYVNVDPSNGFWVTDAKVQGKGAKVVVDTGSSIIIGPMHDVRQLISKLDGVQVFTESNTVHGLFDCNKPPTINFEIGGKNFPVKGDLASYGTANGRCVLSIMGQDGLPLNAWVLGDAWLQSVSVVFDMGNNRMGIAPRKW